ncbi:hypothetical protein ATCC90586_003413 [Pythium insidiosum]|nr:hypothetical protein ATCC90586_003413 [Pythium insidiosum]
MAPSPTRVAASRRSPRAAGSSSTAAAAATAPPPSESDANLLAMLRSTVACLKDKRMDVEALGCMEQALWLQRRMLGADSARVRRALHEVVLSANSLAMQFLALGQFDQCLAMLRKAEAITAPGNFARGEALQILTYNNLGCCYRKLGKLKAALKYLQAAAQLGAGAAHVRNLSITHLNLCAIQSQLGRHDLALEHAQAAIFHTQEELVQLDETAEQQQNQQQQNQRRPRRRGRSADGGGDDDSDDDKDDELLALAQDALDPKTREEKVVSLAVAYHNLAVELEFNGRGDASLQWYKKAAQLAAKYKATNAALYESFQRIFLDAKRKHDGAAAAVAVAVAVPPPRGEPPARGVVRPRPRSAAPRDLSYNATVAASCYKPSKPSAAGLRYYDSTPKARLARVASSTSCSSQSQPQPQSQSQAQTGSGSRRRPLSASGARATASRQANAPTAARAGARPSSASARRRPMSARAGVRQAVARQRPQQEEEKEEDDDDACGVIDDDGDGDDDDELSQFPVTASGGRRIPSERRPTPIPTALVQPARARHRRVLRETRSLEEEEDEDEGDDEQATESTARSKSSRGGYAAEDDETESAESSAELPQQRLSHMEYLRRMKALAETIREDLDDRPTPAAPAPASASASGASTATSTPRSNSKVRERLEVVRRDSAQSLARAQSDDSAAVALVLREDRVVQDSELAAARAEHALVLAASARRVQTSVSAHAARRRVRRLQRVRGGGTD